MAESVSDGSTIRTIWVRSNNSNGTDTKFILGINTDGQTGVISEWDATKIEITWTRVGSPSSSNASFLYIVK